MLWRRLLPVSLCLISCLWLIAVRLTHAQVKAQPGRPGQWQVLVFDQTGLPGKDGQARWSTVVGDGQGARRLDGTVVSLGGGLFRLKTQRESKRETCPQGKFPFSYMVDQLVAEPLGGGPTRVVMGQMALSSARSLLKEHMDSCDTLKPLPFAPDTSESYERSRLRLLSVYQDSFGVETVTESLQYGRPAAMVANDWASYRFDGEEFVKLSKKHVPAAAFAEASARFARLAASEKEGFSPDFSHFVLAPQGGGAAIEFGVPGVGETVKGAVRAVRVVRGDVLSDKYNKMRDAFVASHPKLINWEKASFYTVCPDQSAVVYAQDGKLFWQGTQGKSLSLGTVKEVRGWQWHDGSSLTAAERSALGAR